MGIPDHLTCLLRNLYAGQEATVRTGHGRTDWFQIGKGVHQGCILLLCLFKLYVEYIMRNAGLEEAQAGIKIARRIINNLGKMLKGTSSTLATSCEGLTYWKRLWCWEGLGAGGEGTTEDERAGWHHWLDGHESEWTPGVGDGQGGLVYCDSWGCKESDTTERLNWTELRQMTPHLWQKVKRNWRASWCKWKKRGKKLA